ncbi:MAG: thioesterase family protein [Actinomycetota bacterium]|nr:thioesterase family protein [Actinomycetota bacterium]
MSTQEPPVPPVPTAALTASQVREVSASDTLEVTPDLIDDNGHMNIAHYFHPAARSVWRRLQELGVDDDYLSTRRLSLFTAEHHLRYLAEMRMGDRFSLRPQLLARSSRVVHGIVYVLDETHERLACTLEATFVHVSMDERHAVPIADDVAAAIDGEIERATRAWPPPLCGAMGVRRAVS